MTARVSCFVASETDARQSQKTTMEEVDDEDADSEAGTPFEPVADIASTGASRITVSKPATKIGVVRSQCTP